MINKAELLKRTMITDFTELIQQSRDMLVGHISHVHDSVLDMNTVTTYHRLRPSVLPNTYHHSESN